MNLYGSDGSMMSSKYTQHRKEGIVKVVEDDEAESSFLALSLSPSLLSACYSNE
jgi:hypothetical protein